MPFACLQVIIHRKAQLIIKVTAPRKKGNRSQKGKMLPVTFAHLYYCHLEKEQLVSCLTYQSAKNDFGQGIHFHRGTCMSTELNFWGKDLQRQSCLQHLLHTLSYPLQILLTNHRLCHTQSTGNPSAQTPSLEPDNQLLNLIIITLLKSHSGSGPLHLYAKIFRNFFHQNSEKNNEIFSFKM